MGEIVRYLHNNNKIRLPLKLSLLHGSRPKSARASPQQCAHSAPVLTESVHFRRSYSRMREHCFYPVEYFYDRAYNNE